MSQLSWNQGLYFYLYSLFLYSPRFRVPLPFGLFVVSFCFTFLSLCVCLFILWFLVFPALKHFLRSSWPWFWITVYDRFLDLVLSLSAIFLIHTTFTSPQVCSSILPFPIAGSVRGLKVSVDSLTNRKAETYPGIFRMSHTVVFFYPKVSRWMKNLIQVLLQLSSSPPQGRTSKYMGLNQYPLLRPRCSIVILTCNI